jgi:antitoxin PrlF
MIASKLTSSARTTIPRPVRTALGLRAGDEIAYGIESGRVFLTGLRPGPPAHDYFAAFWEWGSDEDAEAYRSL